MMRTLVALATFAAVALPACAQNWSLGAGTGPFVFGTFVRRSVRAGNELPSGNVSHFKLTARTRPGLSVDLERNLNDRFAFRVGGTFTEAPIAVRGDAPGSVVLAAGKMDVSTFTLPLVLRLNPRGTFRFYLLGGPAYAMYHIRRPTSQTQIAVFHGTRDRLGFVGGGGIEWWWSNRFAVEGQVADIDTASPFNRNDFATSALVSIPRTHNVHTTVGLRLKF